MPIWSPAFFGSAAGSSGYVVEDSVWFDGAADYVTRTPSGAGNRRTFTISWWHKAVNVGEKILYFAQIVGTYDFAILRHTTDQLDIYFDGGSSGHLRTTQVFRDTAWMHFCVSVDTTQASASNRVKLFVNGSQVTAFGTETYPSQNYDTGFSSTNQSWWGYSSKQSAYGEGYFAECIAVDGTASSDASEFGEYSDDAIWIPKEYSGSYGTNGFKLNFSNSSSLGADTSGNGNNFTVNSIAASQQVSDSPTNDSDNDIGNYATLSPIDQVQGASTLSNGNLTITGNGNHSSTRSTFQTDGSGKFAWEVTVTSQDTNVVIGLMRSSDQTSGTDVIGNQTNSGWALIKGGDTSSRYNNSDMVADIGASATNGDVYHLELDNSTGDVFAWRKPSGGTFAALNSGNTITAGAGKTALAGTPVLFAQHVYQNTSATNPNVLTYNFGQTTFDQAPSSSYKAANTANLAAPTVTDPSAFYQTAIWTGDGTAIGSGGKTITFGGNSDMVPDLVWVKRRNEARSHQLYNSVWGWGKANYSDLDDATGTISEGVSAVTSDGFTVGNNGGVNESSDTYVAWCLKAGGSGSTNSAGTISTDPTVSVASHGGFSIVKWTNDSGAGTPTIPHGLSTSLPGGGRPEMIITKADSASYYWMVYHKDLSGATHYLRLGPSEAAEATSEYLNDTTPGTATFQTKNNNLAAYDGLAISYCFARVPGLIGIGKYTGNNSADGPNVVVDDGGSGFKPAMIINKAISGTGAWQIRDNARSTYNPANETLEPNTNRTESAVADQPVDFLSNGFKPRTTGTNVNGSGWTYMYIAFAESPFGLNNRAR